MTPVHGHARRRRSQRTDHRLAFSATGPRVDHRARTTLPLRLACRPNDASRVLTYRSTPIRRSDEPHDAAERTRTTVTGRGPPAPSVAQRSGVLETGMANQLAARRCPRCSPRLVPVVAWRCRTPTAAPDVVAVGRGASRSVLGSERRAWAVTGQHRSTQRLAGRRRQMWRPSLAPATAGPPGPSAQGLEDGALDPPPGGLAIKPEAHAAPSAWEGLKRSTPWARKHTPARRRKPAVPGRVLQSRVGTRLPVRRDGRPTETNHLGSGARDASCGGLFPLEGRRSAHAEGSAQWPRRATCSFHDVPPHGRANPVPLRRPS